ncbi:hypothetical protein FGW37_29020 [Streptomyces rectiverticillatus]|uniref:DUF6519 domain-containing protein n=1 Tax=Streptomyces rectiverticillatus TaxID=173860 RepID=UPI0015C32CFE|nr:DUF6519 domain-containing protein [Streptomyces rectiverticillatus]QLE75112.1 hypothetical protein FGW37_29020 [Streptomyces rectiverticillatus]
MQGDFSRVTFDKDRRFSAVLAQQGRVQLDADLNEQTAILMHYMRTLVTDLFGPAVYPAGPEGNLAGGFKVAFENGTFSVTRGRMYVDGILCECERGTDYQSQPDSPLDPDRKPDFPSSFLVYLRVWERLVTAAQEPSLREVALGLHGPDTSARTRVVWQLDWMPADGSIFPLKPGPFLAGRLEERFKPRGTLAAKVARPEEGTAPCDLPPESGYRGPENQLYRVEIHQGGTEGTATFKWSRENASVVLPVRSAAGATLELESLGRDGRLGVEAGDIVEVVDDATVRRAAADEILKTSTSLYRVLEADHTARQVVLHADPSQDRHQPGLGADPALHPVLRRWDHRPEPAKPEKAQEGTDDQRQANRHTLPVEQDRWIDLEDGVQIRFGADEDEKKPQKYRTGDYWLIPARVVTGEVEWPKDGQGEWSQEEPHGVGYHYAPLALVIKADGADKHKVSDARTPLRQPPPHPTGPGRPDQPDQPDQ